MGAWSRTPFSLASAAGILPAGAGCSTQKTSSFAAETATALRRERRIARVLLDKPGVAENFETTVGHVYLHLEGTVDEELCGHSEPDLDVWAKRLQTPAKRHSRQASMGLRPKPC
jgi:uncharacterized protein YecE (DUF72 family)